ncbi:MAG: adenosylcobinamide-GDP ribazoletransferase [Fervidicoccaceae archaeon]
MRYYYQHIERCSSLSASKRIKALLSLMTRIPLGEQPIEEAAKAFYLVPLIGTLEGLIVGSIVALLVWLGVIPVIISILYFFLHIVLTGGIHLDGFADYLDVIGSHKCGDQALRVLKDPRKGSYAVVVTSLRVVAGVASLSVLVEYLGMMIVFPLVASYIASAEAMFVSCLFGIEEPYEGMARSFCRYSKNRMHVLKNILYYLMLSITLVALGGLSRAGPSTVVVLALPAIVGTLVSHDANKRLGFVNGDVMGFSYELTQTISLILVATLISTRSLAR